MTIQSFHPPKRTLMGPGPSDVYPRITEALSRPTIGHLDPEFVRMMDEVKELLQFAFRTRNALTLPISAPGSAGMEACFVNLIEPGDKVVVCINGVFGGRMKENVERAGGEPVVVQGEWGRAVDVAEVEKTLQAHPDSKILAFVHAETSTGARSDAETLCRLAKEHNCLTIVDAVTSLGGSELEVDAWGIDAIYSGTQKCLSCVPGISPVSFSEKAVEKIANRKHKVQSWFLDMNLIMGYWGKGAKRAYHHTAPVNAMYALHEALVILQEEGIENAWRRHKLHHQALATGLEAMGLELVVPEAERLSQLNAVRIPDGIDDVRVRSELLSKYNLEIGAGLGDLAGKVWRIGLMGCSADQTHVLCCLGALQAVLGSDKNGAAAALAFYRSQS
ncbi:alanine--glyoxylate aminotransferase family protein [Endozoicomonas sp. 8E]|uniref:pyridoxal-phosphate-dependent aminotransferase family protein n=1 Tax=Endozoicomonas sp. 8E TaxID=3035692 RepID=UPI0029392764|nr:alanine--glyoxylate aminotransferase family protein [Endozoicomonas sp. 8E]WOG26636.1 alanine--glyoxylate aminotransferase family protein [Endozoicomonas sp. 8E]